MGFGNFIFRLGFTTHNKASSHKKTRSEVILRVLQRCSSESTTQAIIVLIEAYIPLLTCVRQLTIQQHSGAGFDLFFTKRLPFACVEVAWKRARVRWKGLMRQFSEKQFQVFCSCFCAKFSLTFAVRSVNLEYYRSEKFIEKFRNF